MHFSKHTKYTHTEYKHPSCGCQLTYFEPDMPSIRPVDALSIRSLNASIRSLDAGSVATNLAGGQLGIVWKLNSIYQEGSDGALASDATAGDAPAGGALVPILLFMDRQIPSIEVPPVPPPTKPIKDGTTAPTPESTIQPTPTIALTNLTLTEESPVPPLAVGAGLGLSLIHI